MKKLLFILALGLMSLTSHAQSTLLGDVNGDGKVTVADAMMVVNIIMKGYTPFTVAPTSVSMFVGETTTMEISGGYNKYEVISSNTDVVDASLSGTTITLIAAATGETSVIIKDILTMRQIEIPVTIFTPLRISSNSLSMIAGDQSSIAITSGSGNYSIESNNTNVATANMEENSIVVTAVDAGTAAITITDTKSGQSVTIDVEVDYKPLVISASSMNLFIGDDETVDITSGSGFYEVRSSDTEVAKVLIDGNNFVVSATNVGTTTITVTDTKSGQATTFMVTVKDYLPLSLAFSSLIITPKNTATVEITSGSGSYTVESSDGIIATAEIENNNVLISAKDLGSTNITVTDTKSRQTVIIYVLVSICPDDNHPHMIDLGLPSGTKWACCNVDPNPSKHSPTNFGGYYHWGMTREVSNNDYLDIYDDISGTEYDVAHVMWGGNWQIPSLEQFEELVENCTFEWTTMYGTGCLFKGKNGGVIFLPAAGMRHRSNLQEEFTKGFYWSGRGEGGDHAYDLYFDKDNPSFGFDYRFFGMSIRPVTK